MLRFTTEGGTGVLTKVINVETGEDVGKALAIEYGVTITIGQMVTAECKLAMIEADTVAGKTTFRTKHPLTGRYEAVTAFEFEDGTRVSFADDGVPSITPLPTKETP